MGSSVNAHVDGKIETKVTGGIGVVGPVGPVTIAGIPDTFNINVKEIATIRISAEPVHISIDDLPTIRIATEPVELRLTEVPSTRTHLPADFHVGLSLLGRELMCVRLCGEAQMITEPYKPNPCERCGDVIVQHAPAVVAALPADSVLIDPQDA